MDTDALPLDVGDRWLERLRSGMPHSTADESADKDVLQFYGQLLHRACLA